MNVFIIVALVGVGVVVLGALLAILFRTFNRAVVDEQNSAEVEARSYNPSLTYGYKIPVDADVQTQMRAARLEAARRAAAMPRGANLNIGRGNGKVRTAYQGVENDPMSAAKMAAIHTWEGLRSGASFSPAKTVTHADAETAPPTKSVDDLVPGKDYEYIEITDDMSPAEKRKARIANVKAKSAAAKALKEAAPAAAPKQAPAKKKSPAAPMGQAGSTTVSEPVAGVDYEVIEITDDMSPDEVRKARIANVKAKSAAMKAFKEAGGQPGGQAAPAAQAAPSDAKAEPETPSGKSAAAPAPAAADIPPPDLMEITEDMPPEDVRKARIHNAKAQAAYKKALKDAGIDPKSV
jgi:hypothetical protein